MHFRFLFAFELFSYISHLPVGTLGLLFFDTALHFGAPVVLDPALMPGAALASSIGGGEQHQ